ncbi:hypothetical protein M569_01081, partial [Genlisea aurea]
MADPKSSEVPSASGISLGSSDSSTLQLNIKTLDSRMYTFLVDKHTIVSAFKEKIASQSGVPVAQQRLIFRGKVLKDHHPLSEYNVENGDTLHLVERQPQPSSVAGEATPGNDGQRHDSNAGASRGRMGSIAHSIVLGTVNIGDPTEAGVPDLNRIIGAVLNTVGIGHQASFQVNGAGVPPVDASREENVNPPAPVQNSQPQATIRAVPIPLGAAIPIPSLHMPIPDSLNTIVEFISRMEEAFFRNGNQPSLSTTAGDRSGGLPSNSRGLPSVDALRIVLQRAQALLSNQAIPALSRTADRLSEEAGTNDPAARGQIQMESVQLGMAMQHLGALFLELGRTVLTLRLGQSSDESSVNAGPAVYISPSGPNPIMVQPFPLQTSSLFGSSAGISANDVSLNPVGVAAIPRNVNIHIHTGMRAASGACTLGFFIQYCHCNFLDEFVFISGASLSPAVPTVANRVSNGGHRGSVAHPNDSDNGSSGTNVSPSPGSVPSDSTVVLPTADVPTNPDVGNGFPDLQNDNEASLSTNDGSSSAASDQGVASLDGSSSAPLGLGPGGLQPKRRARQARSARGGGEGDASHVFGQQVLQSLASSLSSSGRNLNRVPVETPSGGVERLNHRATDRQNTDDQSDVTDTMSQLLQSPSLDGVLAGVSQQIGVGSPDMFRSMLQQFTRNPAIRNTMNNIAQQFDSQNLDGLFSGGIPGGGGGGGVGNIDLSRMMQQMMPIVSQALGG